MSYMTVENTRTSKLFEALMVENPASPICAEAMG